MDGIQRNRMKSNKQEQEMAPERGKTILFGREKKGRGEDKTRDPPPGCCTKARDRR